MELLYPLFLLVNRLYSCLNWILDRFLSYSLQDGPGWDRQNWATRNSKLSCHRVNIIWKKKTHDLAPNSTENFLLSHVGYEKAQAALLQDNVSLFCLTATEAVFAVVPPGINVYDSKHGPFVYTTQYNFAEQLIRMSLDNFIAFSDELGDPKANVVLLSSSGRCGSTLLTQMMEGVPNTVNISEPDCITNCNRNELAKMPASIRSNLGRLLRACIRVQCKNLDSMKADHFVIKTRSQSIALAKPIAEACPNVKHIFMYREPKANIKSYNSMVSLDHLPAFVIKRMMGQFMNIVYDTILPEGSNYKIVAMALKKEMFANPVMIKMFAALWCMQVQCYREYAKHVDFATIDYKDLLANPDGEMRKLLEHCDMADSSADLTACLNAMSKDSQSGSVLSRDNLKGSKKKGLSEEQLYTIQSIMNRFNFPMMEDYKQLFQ